MQVVGHIALLELERHGVHLCCRRPALGGARQPAAVLDGKVVKDGHEDLGREGVCHCTQALIVAFMMQRTCFFLPSRMQADAAEWPKAGPMSHFFAACLTTTAVHTEQTMLLGSKTTLESFLSSAAS